MTFDWKTYTGNLSWLPDRTIYMTRHGSHAYGTSLPTSDMDLRGVAIAPRSYYLGFLEKFEQCTQKEPDLQVHELRKFVQLATDANPNILELLYTDSSDHLLVTPIWEYLAGHRDLFLSRKTKHTFSGYATQQLRRIQLHYRWLKNPPTQEPTRAEFGLPERTVVPQDQLAAVESAISKVLDEWNWHTLEGVDPDVRIAIKEDFYRRLFEVTKWGHGDVDSRLYLAAARHVGVDTNFIELLDLERRFNGRKKEWHDYQTWKKERNPARAELEAKFGFDTKHGMHLVRLLRMGREVLTTGKVIVRRPDAEELLSIRAGAWSYERLVEWSQAEDLALDEIAKTSPLPHAPDRKRINALCIEIAAAALGDQALGTASFPRQWSSHLHSS